MLCWVEFSPMDHNENCECCRCVNKPQKPYEECYCDDPQVQNCHPLEQNNPSVYHQYYQQPCLICGKVHFQQSTSVTGYYDQNMANFIQPGPSSMSATRKSNVVYATPSKMSQRMTLNGNAYSVQRFPSALKKTESIISTTTTTKTFALQTCRDTGVGDCPACLGARTNCHENECELCCQKKFCGPEYKNCPFAPAIKVQTDPLCQLTQVVCKCEYEPCEENPCEVVQNCEFTDIECRCINKSCNTSKHCILIDDDDTNAVCEEEYNNMMYVDTGDPTDESVISYPDDYGCPSVTDYTEKNDCGCNAVCKTSNVKCQAQSDRNNYPPNSINSQVTSMCSQSRVRPSYQTAQPLMPELSKKNIPAPPSILRMSKELPSRQSTGKRQRKAPNTCTLDTAQRAAPKTMRKTSAPNAMTGRSTTSSTVKKSMPGRQYTSASVMRKSTAPDVPGQSVCNISKSMTPSTIRQSVDDALWKSTSAPQRSTAYPASGQSTPLSELMQCSETSSTYIMPSTTGIRKKAKYCTDVVTDVTAAQDWRYKKMAADCFNTGCTCGCNPMNTDDYDTMPDETCNKMTTGCRYPVPVPNFSNFCEKPNNYDHCEPDIYGTYENFNETFDNNEYDETETYDFEYEGNEEKSHSCGKKCYARQSESSEEKEEMQKEQADSGYEIHIDEIPTPNGPVINRISIILPSANLKTQDNCQFKTANYQALLDLVPKEAICSKRASACITPSESETPSNTETTTPSASSEASSKTPDSFIKHTYRTRSRKVDPKEKSTKEASTDVSSSETEKKQKTSKPGTTQSVPLDTNMKTQPVTSESSASNPDYCSLQGRNKTLKISESPTTCIKIKAEPIFPNNSCYQTDRSAQACVKEQKSSEIIPQCRTESASYTSPKTQVHFNIDVTGCQNDRTIILRRSSSTNTGSPVAECANSSAQTEKRSTCR